eukprot:Pgem_evm3s1559
MINNNEILPVVLNGCLTGAMMWVSTVEVPMLLQLANSQSIDVVRAVFQTWWPLGKQTMLRLLPVSVLANVFVGYCEKKPAYFASAALVGGIGAWTGCFMMDSTIAPLMEGVGNVACLRKFCNLHHPRIVVVIIVMQRGINTY